MYNMFKVQVPVEKLFYENKVNEIYVEEADDLLSNYKIIHIFHNDYYEKCVVSLDELFSKEIFHFYFKIFSKGLSAAHRIFNFHAVYPKSGQSKGHCIRCCFRPPCLKSRRSRHRW